MRKCGAIVLAAGKGTRMKSEKAKVTFTLAEKPLIQRVVNVALDVNCETVAVVVGYKKEEAIASLSSNSKIKFVEQKEQKGTGHAVMVTERMFDGFDGDILILCGDVPLLTQNTLEHLRLYHNEEGASCTVLTVKLSDPGSYGRIVRNSDGSVSRIVEYKDATDEEKFINEINSGIYCFNSRDLFRALSEIDSDNEQGEYYLTDTLQILRESGQKVCAVVTDNVHEVSGINSQQQLSSLEVKLYNKIKEYWLNNGVTIENPDSVIIGEDVKLANDVIICANTILKGNSRVGSYSHIGPNSYLQDSEVSEGVIIEGFNVMINARVEKEVKVRWGDKIINDR